jgi:hypothetical protein
MRLLAFHVGTFLSSTWKVVEFNVRTSGCMFSSEYGITPSDRHSGLINPTVLWLTAQVSAGTILIQSAWYGPYSRNYQIDGPNGSALMVNVTGGARTLVAWGHCAHNAADINPWSMEEISSGEVHSLSGGRLLQYQFPLHCLQQPIIFLEFKLSLCYEWRILSFGWFTDVCSLNANVLEHCLFHLHRRVGRYDVWLECHIWSVNGVENMGYLYGKRFGLKI